MTYRYGHLMASRIAGIPTWTTFSEDPDLISLAGGLPDTSLFGAELHADLLSEVAYTNSPLALQYGPTRGLAKTKECALEVMAAEGLRAEADQIMITTGAQQGLDLLCRSFLEPGDVVIAEGPTFPGAILPLRAAEAEVVQIPMDEQGLLVEEIPPTVKALRAQGKRVKFIYVVPTFQNPSGKTLSLERRARLLSIAADLELPIIEDNPYGLVRYEGDPLPTVRAMDPDSDVIYLGTFSKILGPGLRVGWLLAPPEVLAAVDVGKQCADLCPPTTSQLLINTYFARGQWRHYLDLQIDAYRRRRDILLAALPDILPFGSRWTVPEGGLFVWVTLPEGMDSRRLSQLSLEQSVSIVTGPVAYVDQTRGTHEFRLNFSAMSEERLSEGLTRLGRALREMSPLHSVSEANG
jgi:2-aminoadipate transaminase